jgi:hypothetical protein
MTTINIRKPTRKELKATVVLAGLVALVVVGDRSWLWLTGPSAWELQHPGVPDPAWQIHHPKPPQPEAKQEMHYPTPPKEESYYPKPPQQTTTDPDPGTVYQRDEDGNVHCVGRDCAKILEDEANKQKHSQKTEPPRTKGYAIVDQPRTFSPHIHNDFPGPFIWNGHNCFQPQSPMPGFYPDATCEE